MRVLNDLSKGGHLPKPYSKGLGSCCPTKDNKVQQSGAGLKMMLMCRSHIGLNKCKAVANLPFAKEVVLSIPKLLKRLKKVQGIFYSVSSFHRCQIDASEQAVISSDPWCYKLHQQTRTQVLICVILCCFEAPGATAEGTYLACPA